MTKEEIEEVRRRLGWGPEVTDQMVCDIIGGTPLHVRISLFLAFGKLKEAFRSLIGKGVRK